MSLKTVTMRRVECDSAGCSEATDVTSSDGIEARFEAADKGWKYATVRVQAKGSPQRRDYCPTHAAAGGKK